MAIRACYAAPRTPWAMLRVQTGDRALPTTLTGPARLIALYEWRRGAALPGVWFVDGARAQTSPSPDDVDWSLFPTPEAQHEMMDRDERCARHFPRRSWPS